MHEAQAVRDFTFPDAIVLMGVELPDDDVAIFHYDHFSRANVQPLFMVLSKLQAKRLNGRIHTPGCYVITENVNLGKLRRIIEDTLGKSSAPKSEIDCELRQQRAALAKITVN